MIDKEGYRENVAIVIMNDAGKLFWCKRIEQKAWQFPQGGVHEGETPIVTMYRELLEEVGLRPQDVEIMAATPDWLYYRLPFYLRRKSKPRCIGQKQKWFLLKLLADESSVNFNQTDKPEFDGWCWTEYWHPVSKVIQFKSDVYKEALTYFRPFYEKIMQNPPKE